MQILTRIADPRISLHSPELVDLEVLSALRRYELSDIIPPDRIARAIDNLSGVDMRRHRHGPILPRIWSWRYNLTSYDAAYITLAEVLDAPLLTTDARLAGAPRLPVRVEVFARSRPPRSTG